MAQGLDTDRRLAAQLWRGDASTSDPPHGLAPNDAPSVPVVHGSYRDGVCATLILSARRREGGSRSVLPREGGDGVRQPGQACCRAAYVAYIRCAGTTMGRSGQHRGGTGVPHLVMGETPTPNEVRPPWGWRTATLGWEVTAMYHIRPSALTGVMLEAALSYIRYRGAERCRLGRGRTWLQRAHPAAWLSCVARGWTVTTQ